MPTTLRRLPGINPDSVGLPAIDLTDDDIRLFKDPRLLYWVDGSGFDAAKGVRERKTDRYLTAARGGLLPTKATLAAYNNKPAMVFGQGSANGELFDGGAAWLPVNQSFAVAFVGRHGGPTDNSFPWGSGEVATSGSSATFFSHLSTGSFGFQLGGQQVVGNTSTAYQRLYAAGPTLSICSFNHATKVARMRLQRGAFDGGATLNASAANTNGILHIGAAGSNGAGTVDGGDFGALLVFNTSLHDAANLDLRALVESVLERHPIRLDRRRRSLRPRDSCGTPPLRSA